MPCVFVYGHNIAVSIHNITAQKENIMLTDDWVDALHRAGPFADTKTLKALLKDAPAEPACLNAEIEEEIEALRAVVAARGGRT